MKLALICAVAVAVAVMVVCAQPNRITAHKCHTVGGEDGWGPGVDYVSWAKSKTFHKGDVLLFQYTEGYGVEEVRGKDFKRCDGDRALYGGNDGNTSIPLKSVGTHFFICSEFEMCSEGMNMTIVVTKS